MEINKIKNKINELEKELIDLKKEYNQLIKCPQKNILLKHYLSKLPDNINIKSKIGFINFCLENLETIKTHTLPQINHEIKPINLVLIEFREQPHLEFILRNNILKLQNKVNYTVVCGNKNFQMINNFKINNLNIIVKNYDNITRGEYSQLLASKEFWEQFDNEYILINQSDSIVFNSNIDDFLGYDYIGAPWLKPTRNNQLFAGNGGFSLRKRETMIKICNTFDIKEMPRRLKPIKFMIESDNNICPEDVYFSQYLLRIPDYKLPDFDTCINFSMEMFKSNKPFGGHNFFKNKWIQYFTEYINKDTDTNTPKDIINTNTVKGKIKIVKIPNINELLVLNDGNIYENKYLNSDKGKRFIEKFTKNKVNITRKNQVKFSKVLLFMNRWDINWRHFLIETFFNLKDVYKNPDIQIIISKNSPKHIRQLLIMLNINNYFEIDDNVEIISDELIIPTNNPELKQDFLNNVILQSKKLTNMHNLPLYSKLYLTRNNTNKNYRYVSNQNILDDKIKELNYNFFRGGSVPLYYQIALINYAEDIITQIGANCDNIIFCNKKAKFKIIYPFNCKRWAKMYQIYPQCNLLYCGNKYNNNGDKDKYNWNYDLDMKLLNI